MARSEKLAHRSLRAQKTDKASFSIPFLVQDFEDRFPSLPALTAILARLSASPTPFCQIDFLSPAPSGGMSSTAPAAPSGSGHGQTRLYHDALVWLLRHDLVVGAPARVLVFAREEVKVKAREAAAAEQRRMEEEQEDEEEEGRGLDEEGGGGQDEDDGQGWRPEEADPIDRDVLEINTAGTTLIEHPSLAHGALVRPPSSPLIGRANWLSQALAWLRTVCAGKTPDEVALFQRCLPFSLLMLLLHR